MEEAPGKDGSTISTIDIFLCYAHEDEEYRQLLEKQLSLLQRNERIHLWHNGKINPGEARKQATLAHLNTAQIVLLLVSPNFIASLDCDEVMKKALERQKQGKTHVIPIVVSPVVGWQDEPLGMLQALPRGGKHVRSASWRNLDEAFFEVAKGIYQILEEIKAQPLVFPLSSQQLEKNGKTLQCSGILKQKPLSEAFLTEPEVQQESIDRISSEGLSQAVVSNRPIVTGYEEKSIQKRKHRNLREKRLLIALVILLALIFSLLPFLRLSECFAPFCRPSQQPAKPLSPLSMELVAVASPSLVLSDDSKRGSSAKALFTSVSAVSLTKNTSTYDTIVINVQNLQYKGADILIDSIALKLLSIPVLPNPLKVWTPGATKYFGYPYSVTYDGQTPDQLLYAASSQNVILTPRETDPLLIEVMSTVTAYLQFQVQITYQITGAPQTLTLPQTFQVAFSDASNWQEYILQNGFFVEKS